MLCDYGTHLEVRSISVNAEWYFVVGVCHKDIHSQYGFHDFKDLAISGVQQMVFYQIHQAVVLSNVLFRTHELACIDSTKETTHFLDVAWWLLFKNQEWQKYVSSNP